MDRQDETEGKVRFWNTDGSAHAEGEPAGMEGDDTEGHALRRRRTEGYRLNTPIVR